MFVAVCHRSISTTIPSISCISCLCVFVIVSHNSMLICGLINGKDCIDGAGKQSTFSHWTGQQTDRLLRGRARPLSVREPGRLTKLDFPLHATRSISRYGPW